MRDIVKELFKKSVIFKYDLPYSSSEVYVSSFSRSSMPDKCYEAADCEGISSVIYNGIIDYSFNQYDVNDDVSKMHLLALKKRLKFNEHASDDIKIKYGFYGEVLLYFMLMVEFSAMPIISRGYFFNILEGGEAKGYDAYHVIQNEEDIEFWFGEVKFYQSFKSAVFGSNGALRNLKKAISDGYFEKNLIAISDKVSNVQVGGVVKDLLEKLNKSPEVIIADLVKEFDIKLIYPIFIVFDDNSKEYDSLISDSINYVNSLELSGIEASFDFKLFFVLLPVSDSSKIKRDVMKWIEEKKPLM